MAIKNVSLHDIPFDLFLKYFNTTNTGYKENTMKNGGTKGYSISSKINLYEIVENENNVSYNHISSYDLTFPYLNPYFSNKESIVDSFLEKYIFFSDDETYTDFESLLRFINFNKSIECDVNDYFSVVNDTVLQMKVDNSFFIRCKKRNDSIVLLITLSDLSINKLLKIELNEIGKDSGKITISEDPSYELDLDFPYSDPCLSSKESTVNSFLERHTFFLEGETYTDFESLTRSIDFNETVTCEKNDYFSVTDNTILQMKDDNSFFIRCKKGDDSIVLLITLSDINKFLYSAITNGEKKLTYTNASLLLFSESGNYSAYKDYINIERKNIIRYIQLDDSFYNKISEGKTAESNRLLLKKTELKDNESFIFEQKLVATGNEEVDYSGYLESPAESYIGNHIHYLYKKDNGDDIGLLVLNNEFVIPQITDNGKIIYQDQYGLDTLNPGYSSAIEDHGKELRRVIFGHDHNWNVIYSVPKNTVAMVKEGDDLSLRYWSEVYNTVQYDDELEGTPDPEEIEICSDSFLSRRYLKNIMKVTELPERKAIEFSDDSGKTYYEITGFTIPPTSYEVADGKYKFTDSSLWKEGDPTRDKYYNYSSPYKLNIVRQRLRTPSGTTITLSPVSLDVECSFEEETLEEVTMNIVELGVGLLTSLFLWHSPALKNEVDNYATTFVRTLINHIQGDFGRASIFNRDVSPYVLCEIVKKIDVHTDLANNMYMRLLSNGKTVLTRKFEIKRDADGIPTKLVEGNLEIPALTESEVISRTADAQINRTGVITRLFKIPVGEVTEIPVKKCIGKLKSESATLASVDDGYKDFVTKMSREAGLSIYKKSIIDFTYDRTKETETETDITKMEFNYCLADELGDSKEKVAFFLTNDANIPAYSMKELEMQYLVGDTITVPNEIFNSEILGFNKKVNLDESELGYSVYEKITYVRDASDPTIIKRRIEKVYWEKDFEVMTLPSTNIESLQDFFIKKGLFVSDDYVLKRGRIIGSAFPLSEQKTVLRELLMDALNSKSYLDRESHLFNFESSKKMLEFAKGLSRILSVSGEKIIEKQLESKTPTILKNSYLNIESADKLESGNINSEVISGICNLTEREIPNVYQRLLLYEKFPTTDSLLNAMVKKKYELYISSLRGDNEEYLQDSSLEYFINKGNVYNSNKPLYALKSENGDTPSVIYNMNSRSTYNQTDALYQLRNMLINAIVNFTENQTDEGREKTLKNMRDSKFERKIERNVKNYLDEKENEKILEEMSSLTTELPERSRFMPNSIDFVEVCKKLNMKTGEELWRLYE